MRRRRGRALSTAAMVAGLTATLAAGAAPARAHKPSDSTLALDLGAGTGRWDIAVRDLDDVLSIDADGDGAVTWGELRARTAAITGYALGRLTLDTPAGACRIETAAPAVALHSDGAYASLPLRLACPAAAPAVTLDYRLLFEVDAQHRGLVRVDGATGGDATFVLSGRDHVRRLALPAAAPAGASAHRLSSWASFVAEGVGHIWGGLDHVLFLLALLLPAVVRRRDGAWVPVPAFRPAIGDVTKVVTAFTVAHSLTLSCAAFGLVHIPARLTEPAIAASVVIAAVNNLVPVFGRDRWVVAFALGLLHGFGFSSVLGDLALPRPRLLTALFGFNLGVELGQLAIVATFVPAAFLLRRTTAYRRVALVGGSAAVVVVALVWFLARLLDLPQWS